MGRFVVIIQFHHSSTVMLLSVRQFFFNDRFLGMKKLLTLNEWSILSLSFSDHLSFSSIPLPPFFLPSPPSSVFLLSLIPLCCIPSSVCHWVDFNPRLLPLCCQLFVLRQLPSTSLLLVNDNAGLFSWEEGEGEGKRAWIWRLMGFRVKKSHQHITYSVCASLHLQLVCVYMTVLICVSSAEEGNILFHFPASFVLWNSTWERTDWCGNL